jgi:uncharacterized membrane protein
MEQMNTDQLSGTGLQVDSEVRQHFADGAKWSKFIAVTMFIACGLILLIGLAASSTLATAFSRFGSFGSFMGMGAGIFMIVLILGIAIFAMLFYFLFNFSSKIKSALITGNSDSMNAGLSSLKIYFIIAGIFGILSLLMTLYSLFQTSKYL